jgi:ATP/maltotriose-dependent transcriptional regulator MalT/DNA-binding SARP family transcriptional activator
MTTPRVKLLPPRLPATHVRRPALEELLGEAGRRRLTSIVAGAGFGKSTLVASLAGERSWAWYLVDGADASLPAFARGLKDALALDVSEEAFAGSGSGRGRAEALAAVLVEALEKTLGDDLVLVIDDVHELGTRGASVHLLESLVRQAPPELHFVLCSREEVPFAIERLRGRGQVLDVDASLLAFSDQEVAGVFGGDIEPRLAARVHELTAGWPAAVQLAAEMLNAVPQAEREEAVAALGRRSGPLVSYLAEEVVGREPEDVRDLLRAGAQFDRFTAELCQALGVSLSDDALAGLRRRGLVVSRSGPEGWFSMHAVLRDFVRENLPPDEKELRELHRRAAAWFGSQGLLREALASLRAAGDPKEIVRFFDDHWRPLIDRGFADAVIEAAELLPQELVTEDVRHLVGRSYAILGSLGRALDWLSGVPMSPELAFQLADIHIYRGETGVAFDTLVAATPTREGETHSMNFTYIAFAAPAFGELEIGRDAARRALEATEASGDLSHQADAHVALADIAQASGDPESAERHYQAGLELAERAGNLLALSAAQAKTARFLATRGFYQPALGLVEAAIGTADRIGFAQIRSEGRHVRGSIYLGLGRIDEAAAEFEAAKALDVGSGRIAAWATTGLGDLYRERGDLARARNAYEEILETAAPRLVRARAVNLAGLARTIVDDDPQKAAELAAQAVEVGVNERPAVLLAAGWIALQQADRERAAELAAGAADEARRRGVRPWLAESLELRALSADEPDRASLEEALAIWRDIEAAVAVQRVEFALAHLFGSRLELERAKRELRRLGVREAASRSAGILMALGREERPPLLVQTLGGFRVFRDGEPITHGAWRSKKARDLLKILVARRGRPVPRDELIELLWPEEDPDRTPNRLSVALSTLRSVLDPARRFGQDHFIAATDGAVRLSLETAEIDLEAFLAEAGQGLRLWRDDRGEEVRALLDAAEGAYTGDFLEEDRYEDWAEPTRDEARAVYVEVLRALAETGETRYFLRIVERDRYDEQAHLGLVATLARAGSHGEARRAYRTYLSRMEEIAAEPAPFPEPTALSRA